MPVKPLAYTGVNLAGGESGERKPGVPAVYSRAYTYPTADEITYFAGKGVNVIRLPFRWVDLQPALNQSLDAVVLGRLREGGVTICSRWSRKTAKTGLRWQRFSRICSLCQPRNPSSRLVIPLPFRVE